MGMSTSVVGFKPPDKKWEKMKKIYDACEESGVTVPEEVDDFFGDKPPDNTGVRVELEQNKRCCSKYSAESQNGFEINVDKLPKDVVIIRFVNSF